jgi:uracil-DNA glycosylase family 4
VSVNELLDIIASEVTVCTKCSLWETRKNAVPGEGTPKARILFIGEAPGRSEDVKGRPFVGDAGKFLETLLAEMNLSRTDVFICNVLKCRPPGNRPPKPVEIQTCTPYLDRQINAINPRFIVTLGNFSTVYIFQKTGLPFTTITNAHGKFHEATVLNKKITIFPTFHPAAALYSPKYKQEIINDFKLLKRELAKRGKT